MIYFSDQAWRRYESSSWKIGTRTDRTGEKTRSATSRLASAAGQRFGSPPSTMFPILLNCITLFTVGIFLRQNKKKTPCHSRLNLSPSAQTSDSASTTITYTKRFYSIHYFHATTKFPKALSLFLKADIRWIFNHRDDDGSYYRKRYYNK